MKEVKRSMNTQKNNKRRQHYVPKFYLRNFSENDKSVGIYRFKENKIIKYGSINENLWEEYFYGEDAVVENKLAEYEGIWDNIISTIIKTERLPKDPRALVQLRYFMLMTSARTLKRGNQTNDIYSTVIKKVLEVENPELFEKIMRGNKDELIVKIDYPALLFMSVVQELLPIVLDLKIDLLINKSSIDYVTSDNPVVLCNELFQKKNLSRGFGLGEYGIQLIVPVSPQIAICMYDSEVYTIKKKNLDSNSTINKLNELFLNNSDKMIVFMYGGDDKKKNEKLNYVNKLVEKRVHSSVQNENGDMIGCLNKQVLGEYDLSDVFEIKQKYKEMCISNHSEEEINEKLKAEIDKFADKLQTMTEDEIQTLLESKKGEFVVITFDDMIRPRVKLYDELKNILRNK